MPFYAPSKLKKRRERLNRPLVVETKRPRSSQGDAQASPPLTPRWRAPTRAQSALAHDPLNVSPIPRRASLPRNGVRFTWADDALNLAERARESHYAHATLPPQHSLLRCTGWSRRQHRPCRAWVAKNIEGTYAEFCVRHITVNDLLRPGRALTPGTIVAHASKAAKHGAYSEILRLQIAEVVRAAGAHADPDEHARDMELVQALDETDIPSSLQNISTITEIALARMLRRFYAGEMSEPDFMKGVLLFGESLRKILATRHEVQGSASDELAQNINTVLEEIEHGKSSRGEVGRGEDSYPGE